MKTNRNQVRMLVAAWIDDATGYRCEIWRIDYESFDPYLCGYVKVPEDHPLHALKDEQAWDEEATDLLDAHGGVTFADGKGTLGFDQHHGWDHAIQNDVGRCRENCERLARSLKRQENRT